MSGRLTMPGKFLLLAAIGLCSIATMRADQLVASAQQILKEQGFYYGNADGRKNTETTAAIRRYQIRNGLEINGELNIETQRSLGIRAERSSIAEKSERSPSENFASIRRDQRIFPSRTLPNRPQRLMASAQTMLARRGYYRSKVDGVYGPETEIALRLYQARVGLAVTGRLDLDTLAAMGMLPGRQRVGPRYRPFPRARPEPVYQGELVPE
jgi:peptidoglycan hydrolase-like protein with peptidoglycan-binding domain